MIPTLAVLGPEGSPQRARAVLHVARATLVQACAGIPAGRVPWADARVMDVQLAEIQWSALSPEERREGERAWRAVHRCDRLEACALAARLRRTRAMRTARAA